jgi:hypothetical protein
LQGYPSKKNAINYYLLLIMKKQVLFAALFSFFAFSACKNDGGAAANATATTASTTTTTPAAIDKTPKKGEIKNMTGAQITEKFGIDGTSEKVIYGGSYEYYLGADGKEVLHGKFSIKTAEDVDTYISRLLPKGGDPTGEEGFGLRFDFSDDLFEGQFVEGVKDGKMTFEMSQHESGGKGYIIYDAKTKGATEAMYEGGAESICLSYKGALPTGTFKELYTLNKEVDC